MFSAAIGGAALGFIDKSLPQLPTIPMLGRAGTIALGAYFFSRGKSGSGLIRDIALAASAVAGYQLGNQGHVSGDIPNQVRGDDDVSGIAAQV